MSAHCTLTADDIIFVRFTVVIMIFLIMVLFILAHVIHQYHRHAIFIIAVSSRILYSLSHPAHYHFHHRRHYPLHQQSIIHVHYRYHHHYHHSHAIVTNWVENQSIIAIILSNPLGRDLQLTYLSPLCPSARLFGHFCSSFGPLYGPPWL